jgi:hypothetical protein
MKSKAGGFNVPRQRGPASKVPAARIAPIVSAARRQRPLGAASAPIQLVIRQPLRSGQQPEGALHRSQREPKMMLQRFPR